MPFAPKRPCSYPGCNVLTDAGYCEKHKQATPARAYDQRRGSSSQRGYGRRWQKYREGYLRENPICQDPKGRHRNQVRPAQHVDHIIAVTGPDDPLFWRTDNHRGLCASCHSAKTASEDGGFGNKHRGINRMGEV